MDINICGSTPNGLDDTSSIRAKIEAEDEKIQTLKH